MNANFEIVRNFLLGNQATFIALVCTGTVAYLLKWCISGRRYRGTTRLDGKTVIVTGANTGIGKATAKDLAGRGARVILACRDKVKAQTAANEIRESTGNSDIIVKHLDLASLKSVTKFATEILNQEERLDILINNAGVVFCPKLKTEDGFEMQFAVNHLGHFLLTNLLLDLLKKSAPSRIITVSSMGHNRGKIKFDDINSEKSYGRVANYEQSKVANVLFSRELSKRLHGTGVTTYVLHPGLIATDAGRYIAKESLWKDLLTRFVLFFLQSPEQGASTTVFCAVEPSLIIETGKYYSNCSEAEPSQYARDDGVAKKLWELSEKMVGLRK